MYSLSLCSFAPFIFHLSHYFIIDARIFFVFKFNILLKLSIYLSVIFTRVFYCWRHIGRGKRIQKRITYYCYCYYTLFNNLTLSIFIIIRFSLFFFFFYGTYLEQTQIAGSTKSLRAQRRRFLHRYSLSLSFHLFNYLFIRYFAISFWRCAESWWWDENWKRK